MDKKNKQRDESEEVFKEYYDALQRIENVKVNPGMEPRQMLMEYMMLAESYEKLLKTAVRVAKLGDKAQKKLMKYKEVMDALRNIG